MTGCRRQRFLVGLGVVAGLTIFLSPLDAQDFSELAPTLYMQAEPP